MTFNSNRRIAGKGKGELIVEDPNFDRKLDLITEGGRPFEKEHLLTKISREELHNHNQLYPSHAN